MTGCAVGVEQVGGHRRVEHARRCRARHRAGPAEAPRRGRRLVAGLAPRHPAHPLHRRAPACGHRGDDRVGTEHPLHPGERAPGAVGGRGVTAPEPELAPGGGAEVVGHQPQQRHDPAVTVSVVNHASSCQRTRVDERRRRERALVTPAAREPLAVLGLGLHDHAGAAQPERVEPAEHPVGEHLRRERGFVDACRGRVELDRSRAAPRVAPSPPARAPPRRARAGGRARPGGRSGRAPAAAGSSANAPRVRSPSRARRSTSSPPPPWAASTEPASTVTGHGARNAGDVPGGTTTASSARSSVARAASPAAKVPSAMPARTSATPSSRTRRDDPRRQRVVTTEVARRPARRERQLAGPLEHQPRHELLDRARPPARRRARRPCRRRRAPRAPRTAPRPRGAARRRPHPPRGPRPTPSAPPTRRGPCAR